MNMKETFKKISDVCRMIFGYAIMLTLFVGGLTFVGYLVALCIGGELATAICVFIFKKIVPVMIYVTTCAVLFGLITMYMAGEKALTPDSKKKKN